MIERIEVTFDDPRKPDNEKFANLVDPILLSIFVERVTDTQEKRSLDKLVKALLEGK